MAGKSVIRRWVTAIFDLVAAKKVESEFEKSLATAGKKSGAAFTRELRAAFDKKMADLKVQLAKGLIDPKQFKLQADLAAKQFNVGLLSGMEKARKAGTLTDTEYLKLSRTLKKVGDDGVTAWDRIKAGIVRAGAALAVAFGVRAVIRFGMESIREFLESERVWVELGGTIDATGESFEGLEKRVRAAAAAFQDATIHTDEDYAKSLQRLIAITGDVEGSIRNMNTVADIAARFFGGDLAAATDAVAKGMNTGVVTINRMKFSLDDLAKRSLGAASEQTFTLAGKLKQLNNQWGEFKEQIGGVLFGGRDTVGVLDLLTTSVKSMVRWVDDNREALQRWVSEGVNTAIEGMRTLLGLTRTFLQLRGKLSLTAGAAAFQPAKTAKGIEAQQKALEKQRRDEAVKLARIRAEIASIESEDAPQKLKDLNQPKLERLHRDLQESADLLQQIDDNAARAKDALEELGEKPPPAGGRGGKVDPEAEAREREFAAEIERIRTDLAVKTLQIEQGLTEALAREWVRRAELKRKFPEHAAELEAGFKKQDNANLLLAAGFDQDPLPKMKRTESPFGELQAATETFAKAQPALAKKFSSPWSKALDVVRGQVEAEEGIFAELGVAWAEGGLKGLAALAKGKVKENLAQAVEWLAKAIGLSIFSPGDAGKAFTASATHGAAAAAWGLVGGALGGGGGGASSAAGLGGGSSPNLSRGESMQPAGAEVHLYFKGPKMFSPEMERFVEGNAQGALQRFGPNAKIHIHRDG